MTPQGPEWLDATVRSVRDATPNVRLIGLEPAGGVLPYKPGSHINVSVVAGGRADFRSYSLVGRHAADGCYRIAVKRLAASRGGSRYMWSLGEGARVAVSPPRNLFELEYGRPEYLLIAGGIGITPLIGMASALAQTGAPLRLLYGVHSRADLAFAEELRDLLGSRVRVFVSESGERIGLEAEIGRLHPDAQLYICGPIRMLEEARSEWKRQGRRPEALRFETFASSGSSAPARFVVKVRDRGVNVTVREDQTLLDALADAGIDIMSDCLRGECGICAVNVVAADAPLDHRDVFLSDEQKRVGTMLCACVSRAAGGSITIDTGFREGPQGVVP